MSNRIQQVAASEIALHLDYLRDFGNLEEMNHEELGQSLAERLAQGNLLK